MQYITIILAAFSFLGKGFGKAGENKEMKLLGLAFVMYFIFNYFKKKEAKNTDIGAWCVRLQEAMHGKLNFKIPFLGYIDDGTDEDAIKAVANEIGIANKRTEVFENYELIFGDNLTQELTREGVINDFENSYNLGKAGQKTTGGISRSDNAPKIARKNTAGLNIIVGKKYIVKAGINLRDYKTPYTIKGQTKDGEIFYVRSLTQNLIIGGKSYIVADVQFQLFGYIASSNIYKVIIDAFKAKV